MVTAQDLSSRLDADPDPINISNLLNCYIGTAPAAFLLIESNSKNKIRKIPHLSFYSIILCSGEVGSVTAKCFYHFN
jgi:hypothetical protein